MSSVTFDGQGPKLNIEVSSVPPRPLQLPTDGRKLFQSRYIYRTSALAHMQHTAQQQSTIFQRLGSFLGVA